MAQILRARRYFLLTVPILLVSAAAAPPRRFPISFLHRSSEYNTNSQLILHPLLPPFLKSSSCMPTAPHQPLSSVVPHPLSLPRVLPIAVNSLCSLFPSSHPTAARQTSFRMPERFLHSLSDGLGKDNYFNGSFGRSDWTHFTLWLLRGCRSASSKVFPNNTKLGLQQWWDWWAAASDGWGYTRLCEVRTCC
jgi:hypothetical protein